MKKLVLVGLLPCCLLFSCGSSGDNNTVNNNSGADAALSGKQLSLKYCQSCHLYPEPSILDKNTWERSVLPLMGRRFGIYEDIVPRHTILEGAIDKELVTRYNIFPEQQLVDDETWQKITDYYLSTAPQSLPPIQHDDVSFSPLEQFEIIVPPYAPAAPQTTMVKIDAETSHVYVGGARGNAGSLTILNKNFEVADGMKLPTPPVDLTVNEDELTLTLIGSLILSPSKNPVGQLLHIFRAPGEKEYSSFRNFMDQLKRPVQTLFDDVNGDGHTDIIIVDFGYYTGSLRFYQSNGNKSGAFKKTILRDAPGAVRACVKDMNADGHKDIVALFAQGDEAIFIYYNDGLGGFREERILTFNPSYGSVYFELADMNGDGDFDILYCNGDNGDYPAILKNYHGIRIFDNDGKNKFTETYFLPMYGAYKCSAADFDLDGDLDIAGISYFPDRAARPRQDFVYLKNDGNYSFTPYSLQKDIPARWVTFDTGDLDGDGYQDIVLGAVATSAGKSGQQQRMPQQGSSLVFLKNRGKK